MRIEKYPRTPHLVGSRLQPGDEDLDAVPFARIAGKHLVVEEKLDGANAAISFAEDGSLLLQSRGHYLTGGPREKHFAVFKTWASAHQSALRIALGSRFVLYGEWLYAKHTIFYDSLPHYFMEFDVLDRDTDQFLSTAARRELTSDLPIASVPVLEQGCFKRVEELTKLILPSVYKSEGWRERLSAHATDLKLDADQVSRETDPSPVAEGLYIKVEEGDRVLARFKYIRHTFLTHVVESGSHWLNRPIIPNLLAPGTDIFAEAL